MIFLKKFFVTTSEKVDLLSIIHDIRYAIRDSEINDGLVSVVIPGSGAGLTICEPLPEILEQLQAALTIFPGDQIETVTRRKEPIRVGPRIKSAFLGKSLTLPLAARELLIGAREEIILVDFETKPSRREVNVQVLGEQLATKTEKQPAGVPKQVGGKKA